MRDLATFAILLLVVLLALRNPFVAYLGWGWTSVLSPTFIMYGFMAGARLNLMFAVLCMVMLVFKREGLKRFELNRTTFLLLIFLAHGCMSAALAIPGNPWNASYFEIFVKSLLFALLLPMVVHNRLRLHATVLLVVLAMSLGAGIEGLKSIATLGGHIIRGLGQNMLSDNNHFGAGVVMVLPLAVYAAQYSKHRWTRWGFWGLAAVFAFCVLGTRSRGAFIALLIMASCMAFVSNRKFTLLTLIGIIAYIFTEFFSGGILDRMANIDVAMGESSFLQRMNAWRVSSAIALDHPVFGGGFHAVQSQLTWTQYLNAPGLFGGVELPPPEETARAAHSIYFEVLGDLGFVGLFIFLCLLLNAALTLVWLAAATGGVPSLVWARHLAFTLMLCLIGYAVAGAAVSLAYMELFYILLFMVESLRQIVLRERYPGERA